MIDKDKEAQWDKEMKEVDRLLAKLPTYDPAKPAPGGDPTLRRPAAGGFGGGVSGGARSGGQPGAGTAGAMWFKVGVGVVLAIGVTAWPYSHVCGLKLFFYLIAGATVAITGVWAALASWKRRSGAAHIVSLGVLLWGLGLAALAVLPRLGYSSTPAIWFCPEPPTPR